MFVIVICKHGLCLFCCIVFSVSLLQVRLDYNLSLTIQIVTVIVKMKTQVCVCVCVELFLTCRICCEPFPWYVNLMVYSNYILSRY